MKSLTKLSLAATMIVIASQAMAVESLPVEINGRSWSNAVHRLSDYPLRGVTIPATVGPKPAVEAVLGRAGVVPVSSGKLIANGVLASDTGRPYVEAVLGRAGASPASASGAVHTAQMDRGS
ncbi:MAG: hypothetical protein ACKVQA_16710 [Burkholderiales bacterium]